MYASTSDNAPHRFLMCGSGFKFSTLGVSTTWRSTQLGPSVKHLILSNSMSSVRLIPAVTHIKSALHASQHFCLQPVVYSLL